MRFLPFPERFAVRINGAAVIRPAAAADRPIVVTNCRRVHASVDACKREIAIAQAGIEQPAHEGKHSSAEHTNWKEFIA